MAVHDQSIDRYSSRKLHSNNNIVVRTNFLETDKADTEMWLFRSPQPVTRALSNSPGYPSRPPAKVTISVDPLLSNDDNSSATKFTMELTGSDSENALSAYSLNMSTGFYPMSVFSESRQGEVTVEGKILKKIGMAPQLQDFERYGKLCRERNHKHMTKSRKIKVIDHIPEEHRRRKRVMDVLSFGTAEKKKVKRSRRMRMRKESGEVESIIFRLFERQAYWTFKQLIQHTNEPEYYVREILKRLCVYNKKGVRYELKPELQVNITTCEEMTLV